MLDHPQWLQVLLAGLWRASWQASILAALVLCVTCVLRERLSARWRYRLWMLVLIRLALPVTPSSPMSVFNLAPRSDNSQAVVEQIALSEPLLIGASPWPPVHVEAVGYDLYMRPSGDWWSLLPLVWLLGVSLLALRLLWVSAALGWRMRRLERVKDEAINDLVVQCAREVRTPALAVFTSPAVVTPALVGWLRPRLLLPRHVLQGFSRSELRLIILHELAHHKRRDVAGAWALAILQILHWFNPVVWLVVGRMRIERELACDEMVLATVREPEQRSYGRVIVKLLENMSPAAPQPGVLGIVENSSQIRRRITMIACFSSNRRRWTGVAVVVALVLACVALTDAADPQPREDQVQQAPQQEKPQPAEQFRIVTRSPSLSQRMKEIEAAIEEARNEFFRQRLVYVDAKVTNQAEVEQAWEKERARLLGPGTTGGGAKAVVKPEGFLTISHPPEMTLMMGEAQPAIDQRLREQLNQELPEVRFNEVALADALDYFREVTGINIVVDQVALESAGMEESAPVSIRLKEVSAGEALRLTLRKLGLAYQLQGRVVIVTTAAPQTPKAVTRAYDVTHLLGKAENDDSRERRLNELQQVILTSTTNKVQMASFESKLIITAPEPVHQQVAQVLALLQSHPQPR